MTTEKSGLGAVALTSTDERWATWVAKGREDDRKSSGRAYAVMGAIGLAVLLWLTFALVSG